MKKLLEFAIYLAGVVFLSWNYYKLKSALDVASLLAVVAFFLLGISWFAAWACRRILGADELSD